MPKEIGKVLNSFNGDTHIANGWCLQVQAYLNINAGIYDTDDKKIVLFLSLMTKGEATKWAEGHLKKAETAQTYGTYAAFVLEFKGTFFPKNIADTAIRRLSTLKQTGSIPAYASIFRTILMDTEIEEERTKIMFFCNSLKREISQAILAFETTPTTLSTWLEKALEVEVHRAFMALPSFTKAKDPYTMDINRAYASDDEEPEKLVRKNYLTPQERERRKKNGLCFKCGKKGLIKDCPNHPTVSTRTTTSHKVDQDDDYKEFLEWKAFKAHQLRKTAKETPNDDEEEDF